MNTCVLKIHYKKLNTYYLKPLSIGQAATIICKIKDKKFPE